MSPAPKVEVEVLFLEFEKGDIVKNLTFEPGVTVDTKTILGLWRQGKATVVCAPRSVTTDCAEATVKGVEEYIYPTEFAFQVATNASDGTAGVREMEFVPGGFETREAGHILTYLPEAYLQCDRVFVTFAPEMVSPPEWIDYGDSYVGVDGTHRQFRMQQPLFPTQSINTQFTARHGQPRVVGGGTVSPDGKRWTYVVATAWIHAEDRRPGTGSIGVGDMVLRDFGVSPLLQDVASDRQEQLRVEEGAAGSFRDYSWRHLLSTMGVTWPEGAAVWLVPCLQRLFVLNTPENLKAVEVAMNDLARSRPEHLVDVELLYVECASGLVENKLRESGGRAIDAGMVLQFCREGQCDIVAAPKAITHSDTEATVKGVVEYIYPTEFTERIIATDPATGDTTTIAEPDGFETREVGAIMTVLPEVETSSEGSAVWLTMAPEIVAEPTWRDYGSVAKGTEGKGKATSIRQPFFKTFSVNTRVRVREGETVLIGSAESHKPGRRIFLLATAKIIDVE